MGTVLEEAIGCSSESGIMVLEQKPARKQGAATEQTRPSASSLTTIAWWPMPSAPGPAGTRITLTSRSAGTGEHWGQDADAGRFRAGRRRLHRRRRSGGTVGVLGCVVKGHPPWGPLRLPWGHVRQLDRVSRQCWPGPGPWGRTRRLAPDQPGLASARPMDWPRRERATTAIPARAAITRCWPAAGTGEVLMSRLREGRANTARGAAA